MPARMPSYVLSSRGMELAALPACAKNREVPQSPHPRFWNPPEVRRQECPSGESCLLSLTQFPHLPAGSRRPTESDLQCPRAKLGSAHPGLLHLLVLMHVPLLCEPLPPTRADSPPLQGRGALGLGAWPGRGDLLTPSPLSTGPFPRRRPPRMTTMSIAAWRSWRSKELAGPGRGGDGDGGFVAPLRGELPCCPAQGLSTWLVVAGVPPGQGENASLRESSGGQVRLHFTPPSVFWKVPQLLLAAGGAGVSRSRGLELRLQAEAVCGFRGVSWPDRGG